MAGRAFEEDIEPTGSRIVLENDLIRVAFDPKSGGSLSELTHKSSGATVAKCLSITLAGESGSDPTRLIRAAVGEDSILLADASNGGGLGWQLRALLGVGSTLELEFTVRNRTLHPVPWNPGLTWSNELMTTAFPLGMCVVTDAGGFTILSDGCPGVGMRTRFGSVRPLAPRWGETVQITIIPFSGTGLPVAATISAVVSLSGGSIQIEATEPLRKAKLILLTAAGQTMEATADLDPTAPLEYTFAELGGEPKGLIILDADRNERLRYEQGFEPSKRIIGPEWVWDGEPTPEQYSVLDVEPATRYWASLLRTRDAFLAGDFEAAAHHAETALLYNGDDPLTWIEKAIALRRLGDDSEDAPELPNVHFLAPLEPLARAESFLRGGDSPLMLEALADHPEELIEAACHYMSLGLFDDAARLLTGAIEVCDRPMIRYLYAACALQSAQMRAEAAGAVAAAKALGVVAPWPWRSVERDALARLVEVFPADEQIREYFTRSNRTHTP